MSNPIDFTKTAQNLNEVLFDVKLQNVYSNFVHPKTFLKQSVNAPNLKSIVNQETGQIISVVSRDYRLISNNEALQMGKHLFSQIYPQTKVDELVPFKVVAPATKASVHIDLIHKDVNFNVWEQENWLPFLRVTNSYNRSHTLSFEIGFVRKLCSNGVLFKKNTMKLNYIHSNSKRMEIKHDAEKIEKHSGLFIKNCNQLSEFPIPRKLMFAMVCQILQLKIDLPAKNQLSRKMSQLENLLNIVIALTGKYSENNDTNGYTALNIVSDLVSHQNEYKNLAGFYFNIKSFYTRPTVWMEEFTSITQFHDFDLDKYLEPTVKALTGIEKELGFKWQLN